MTHWEDRNTPEDACEMWARGLRRLWGVRWSAGCCPSCSAVSSRTCARVLTVPVGKAFLPEKVTLHSALSWHPRRWYSGCQEDEEASAADLPEFNISVLVNLLRQENAKDLCVIRIHPELKYVEYFVIVGGTSPRHLQAMAQYTLKVYKYLKQEDESHVRLEGKDTDDWMCIDFGSIVVHFMLPETRETYELEKLWTLRSHDDQLSKMLPEMLPLDFTFGLHQNKD